MKHSDISTALDALGETYGITLKQRPNYTHGRVHVQLTTLDAPVVGIDLDEAIFSLKDRRDLSDQLHRHFEHVAGVLNGALLVNACTSGREPTFNLDALGDDRRREVCDSLARVFLALTEGEEMKPARAWLHQRLGLFEVPPGDDGRCECDSEAHGTGGCSKSPWATVTRDGKRLRVCDGCDLTTDSDSVPL